MALKLTLYDIIKGPVLTDKAYKSYKKLNQLVLAVHPEANKPQVVQAIEKLFNVKVEQIRMLTRKGKNKSIRGTRLTTTSPLSKRAVVTLAKGYSLDLVGQGVVASEEQTAPHNTEE